MLSNGSGQLDQSVDVPDNAAEGFCVKSMLSARTAAELSESYENAHKYEHKLCLRCIWVSRCFGPGPGAPEAPRRSQGHSVGLPGTSGTLDKPKQNTPKSKVSIKQPGVDWHVELHALPGGYR